MGLFDFFSKVEAKAAPMLQAWHWHDDFEIIKALVARIEAIKAATPPGQVPQIDWAAELKTLTETVAKIHAERPQPPALPAPK